MLNQGFITFFPTFVFYFSVFFVKYSHKLFFTSVSGKSTDEMTETSHMIEMEPGYELPGGMFHENVNKQNNFFAKLNK